jgi:purine-binding chemotaxis protein CheW
MKEEKRDMIPVAPNPSEALNDACGQLQFVIFELGSKRFGVPLLQVKEIIEPQICKPVPATHDYFLGIINLRGKIVGVFDLRQRFSLEALDSPHAALMVFESASGLQAALVDRIVAVVTLEEQDFPHDPCLKTSISTEFLLGISSFEEQMLLLMDVRRLLESDEIIAVNAA